METLLHDLCLSDHITDEHTDNYDLFTLTDGNVLVLSIIDTLNVLVLNFHISNVLDSSVDGCAHLHENGSLLCSDPIVSKSDTTDLPSPCRDREYE